ncbi:glycoside hydrolase family 3 C-terminal domain-containing protein [Lachnoanaerobaculum sp. Marseille-Q4761]|uniref:glycoside hydrolase family 3 N-terminal domain-containing protein n=1 Tax=Lachnoanaerobaculum sp. Marseille-Q4761 TaxID=2819511 RepID=UPI001AA1049C|nr:glycoside hydrolase family 3 N-terminal domain-containing protein [Lachnoanaerobaculum sp. Marseille-Q4761]MBO1869582.1 glycoside hydrolase family 3 C-terminal domain-containing protein [Lachnoanaerobaculum sp. Marseille-Q4761]
MLAVNMADVISVVKSVAPHLVAIATLFVAAIVVMFITRKKKTAFKKLARSVSWLIFGLGTLFSINLMLNGPLKTMITLATGRGVITEESLNEAKTLGEEISSEGIVLLKNDSALPLEKGSKINLFGWSSTNPLYGGTGSGGLNDSFPTVSLIEGVKNAGFEVNDELVKFYTDFRQTRPTVGMWGQDWTIPEPAIEQYKEANIFENARKYSDKAIVVIARSGGEGADLPRSLDPSVEDTFVDGGTFGSKGIRYSDQQDDLDADKSYLELSNREIAMLNEVNRNFRNIIVIINASNPMELGFVNEYENISGVIWCPGAGQTGFNALGKILDGEINPSGKTSDIFVYDLKSTPSYNNFGNFNYTNMDEFSVEDRGESYKPSFVNYAEGIYVGYRFYETAAKEGAINYAGHVLYPFGYGLSYTVFTKEMGEIVANDGKISIDVLVTNTGYVAGKEVVQLYYNPPYRNGGIEKASTNLVGFGKTKLLQPGESETVKITFAVEDMASFDEKIKKAYVLEAGVYEISLQEDSHNILDTRTFPVQEDIVYGDTNKRISDKSVATNRLDDMRGDFTVLSRKDQFANLSEALNAPENFTLAEDKKAAFLNNSNYDGKNFNIESDEMPTTNANNNIKLADLRGLAYDDEAWDSLLDKMSFDDMSKLVALGGYQTTALGRIGKVQTVDCDGPSSINNNFTKKGSIGFPATIMLANTFNTEPAHAFGDSIGKMADEMEVSGWYAPAMNTHRSAFAGRNFEYYSEDPLLAGKIASEAVKGAKEHGVYAYIKHFALNDQETNRNYQLMTWADEQTVREIYLRPFEICVKEGNAEAVMSAFNHYGITPASASNEVLNQILRDEWGFRGMVLTDYFGAGGYGYMNADRGIRNGNDFCLTAIDAGYNYVKDKSATSVKALRKASHNILYTTVNSRAYAPENLNLGMMGWQIATIIIDIICIVIAVLLAMKAWKNYGTRKILERREASLATAAPVDASPLVEADTMEENKDTYNE